MLLSSDKILAIKTKTKGDNKNNFSGPSTINVKTKQKTPNKQKNWCHQCRCSPLSKVKMSLFCCHTETAIYNYFLHMYIFINL